MGRETKNGLWLETAGRMVTIGVTAESIAAGKLTSVETIGQGAKVGKGEALVLLTLGKKEIELDSPVKGRIKEVRKGLEKDAAAVAKDPANTWILKIELDASEADDDEDDEEVDDDLLDEDDDE